MQLGYQTIRILVSATLLLVIATVSSAQGRWNYNDVDLRIAERQAIPHYIRHGFEYADIDIRSIMRQRGLLPQNNNNHNSNNGRFISNRPAVHHSTNINRGKSLAMSNHLDDRKMAGDKKSKLFRNKHNSKYYAGKYKKQRFG